MASGRFAARASRRAPGPLRGVGIGRRFRIHVRAADLRHLAAAGHVVEGAAAVGHAAILSGRFRPKGPTVAILSGGNIDPTLHARIVAGANSVEAA
mgnify:CR=1 FL=1